MIAVLFVASLLIYRIRRTERAGCALAFAKTEMVIKLLLVIPAAVTAGVVGYEMLDSTVGALAFVALFGLIFGMIMEFIYRWDIRQVLAHKIQTAAAILIAALIFLGFRYDLTGYNTYLPKQDEIASMAIQDCFFRYNYIEDGAILTDNCRILDLLETEQFEPIYRLAASGVENEQQSDEQVYGINYCYAYFKYHLKNGKEVYRQYKVSYDQLIESMDELLADQTYRERYFPILTMDASEFMDADITYDLGNDVSELEAYQEKMNDLSGESDQEEELVQTEETDAGEQPDQTEETDAGEQTDQTEETDIGEQMDQTEESYSLYLTDENDSQIYGDYLNVDLIGQDLEEFLAAYQEDLREVSFADCLYTLGDVSFWKKETSGMDLYFNWALTYPLNANFTRSLEFLREKNMM
jgi:hypothetical protein